LQPARRLVRTLKTRQQRRESQVLANGFEQRIALEPRVAGETGGGGPFQPLDACRLVTKLGERCANAVGGMMVKL